ncbi:MAG: twin-arginine translocase TatA/TatE family subunit [Paracoccus sp. (in: a-proteobacteria)]|nr:twin-arginine translocase TatA/TatE family subunit [Paracoccus sp. (in: a-proteobacteria)]
MLNNIGLPGLLLIAIVVLVLFGRGKISSLMGEVGKGITAFKKGVKDGSDEVEDASTEAKRDLPGATPVPGEHARDVTPSAKPHTTDRL